MRSKIIENKNLSDESHVFITNHYIKEWIIPFYHVSLSNWELKKDALLKIWVNYSKNNMIHNALDDQSTDFESDNEYHNLVEDILYDDIMDGVRALNYGERVSVNSAWFQIYDTARYHPPHNHGLTGLSLVVFIKYDNGHLPTTFISPFNHVNDGNVMQYVPEGVTEGSMILFPSSLTHYAPVNITDSNRMILSANIDIIDLD
jgi:hypothetical protein